jgi:hypothetical protein
MARSIVLAIALSIGAGSLATADIPGTDEGLNAILMAIDKSKAAGQTSADPGAPADTGPATPAGGTNEGGAIDYSCADRQIVSLPAGPDCEGPRKQDRR